jgi:hypothetical protein
MGDSTVKHHQNLFNLSLAVCARLGMEQDGEESRQDEYVMTDKPHVLYLL